MLDEGGMCARFVRMCIEFALGQRPQTWKGKAANANVMQDVMAALDWQIDPADAKPGHVVCLNFDANGDRFDPGHVAILDDDGYVLECTSNATRGKPSAAGMKRTKLSVIGLHRVSGYFAPLPSAVTSGFSAGPWTVAFGEGTPMSADLEAWMADQPTAHLVVAAAPLLNALGYRLVSDTLRRISTVVRV